MAQQQMQESPPGEKIWAGNHYNQNRIAELMGTYHQLQDLRPLLKQISMAMGPPDPTDLSDPNARRPEYLASDCQQLCKLLAELEPASTSQPASNFPNCTSQEGGVKVCDGDTGSDSWAIGIPPKLYNSTKIHRVPPYMSRPDSISLNPQVLLLGPYHHNDPDEYQLKKDLKETAASDYIRRSMAQEKQIYAAVHAMIPQLMAYYDQLPVHLQDTESFLHMMVTDACAILAILERLAISHKGQMISSPDGTGDPLDSDPILGSNVLLYRMSTIKKDLLNVENQVPLPVLAKVMALQTEKTEEETMKELCSLILAALSPNVPVPDNIQGIHILDVFRNSHTQGEHCPPPQSAASFSDLFEIPSATDLQDAGFTLKVSETTSLTHVSSKRHDHIWPILCLPRIEIDDTMAYVLFNLLALERLHNAGRRRRSQLTSLVVFISNLLKSADDVELLQSKGIIKHRLYSNEDVVKMFYDLSTGIPLDPCSDIAGTVKRINHYYYRRQGVFRWAAALSRRGCPFWEVATLTVSAVALIYGILAYYKSCP